MIGARTATGSCDGVSPEPESPMLQLLRDKHAEIGEMATKTDADLRSQMTSLRADVAADMIDMRREVVRLQKGLSEQIVGLRRTVVEYHTSVTGHGIIISDPEARLRRVEQHLGLSGTDGL